MSEPSGTRARKKRTKTEPKRAGASRSGRPAYLFHFVPRERYEKIIAAGVIPPYPNPQTAPRPGISLTERDPRIREQALIAMANWRSARSAWRAAAFVGIPTERVRRPHRVPRTPEWTTTQGIRLGSDCFLGIWDETAQRYVPDTRAPYGNWP